MAAMICAIQTMQLKKMDTWLKQFDIQDEKLEFKFFISIGGFLPEDQEMGSIFKNVKIEVPSLHIWGQKVFKNDCADLCVRMNGFQKKNQKR